MEREVRVRFAPSPTGVLHIGGLRTALYNYLFARKNGGKMILRIEDTDQSRCVAEAENYIAEALAWCGIAVDESPAAGGEYAPYTQSERKALYKTQVDRLLAEGKAYYAFDTPEELAEMRRRLETAKASTLSYNSISRMSMNNALTLPKEEVDAKIAAGEPHVVRVKIPPKEEVRLNDRVRGWVMVHTSSLDDKVLMKSDGMPTYHLANVVDDYLMKISHVIRGEEWLPSAPLHVLLYRYLGWEDSTPTFAHLPLILKPDGRGKLSKRDAEQYGFPIFPLEWKAQGDDAGMKGFREEGYLKDAFVNFLALLGWSPGNDEELFTIDQLVEKFSLERVTKAGVKFDIQKAVWYNQQYIRSMPAASLAEELLKQTDAQGIDCSRGRAADIAELLRERIDFIPELSRKASCFFAAPEAYVEKVVRKKWKREAKNVLADFAKAIDSLGGAASAQIRAALEAAADKHGTSTGSVMQLLRVAVSGEQGGPDLMKIMEILGTKETASRINTAAAAFDEIKAQAI